MTLEFLTVNRRIYLMLSNQISDHILICISRIFHGWLYKGRCEEKNLKGPFTSISVMYMKSAKNDEEQHSIDAVKTIVNKNIKYYVITR